MTLESRRAHKRRAGHLLPFNRKWNENVSVHKLICRWCVCVGVHNFLDRLASLLNQIDITHKHAHAIITANRRKFKPIGYWFCAVKQFPLKLEYIWFLFARWQDFFVFFPNDRWKMVAICTLTRVYNFSSVCRRNLVQVLCSGNWANRTAYGINKSRQYDTGPSYCSQLLLVVKRVMLWTTD